ncbi:MAG: DMT family transporter [Desulfobacterales bacterium]|nr:DMT family transporter [Desulfobacterales bacterium]
MDMKTTLGCLAVFGSAFFFYLATVVIKWSSMAGLAIDSSLFTLSRFLFGFITVLTVMGLRRQRIRVVKKRYLIGRAVCNAMAVFCFFKGVELTSVAQANILNMTYPLFIAVFSWMFLKTQRDIVSVGIVAVALAGVWLILSPTNMEFNENSLWALGSGISAAVAIMYLNMSRQVHDTQTTLFFMFSLGGLIIFILFFNEMRMPEFEEFKYLFWCSVIAIAGQYLMTVGFKYVTAIEGGIISSTRILLAALLGPVIAMDPSLSAGGWIGAFLIFSGNVFLTLRKARS